VRHESASILLVT